MMQKIFCACGKWIARIEDGKIFIYCSRCNEYHAVDLTALVPAVIVELESMLARLRQLQTGEDALVDGKRPRVFG